MRAGGILMHITSLPSPYGIGTLGKEAFAFADFLKAAGQTYWQILPLGPTGYGDSPYQVDSTFAGNPYLIDLDLLREQGLLTKEELASADFGKDAEHVDFGALYRNRWPILRTAYERGKEKTRGAVQAFRRENPWLEDYALFFAAKRHFGMKPWTDWEDEGLRLRRKEACRKYAALLRDDMDFCCFLQYMFYTQWNALRSYVRSLGIKIIGDVPIYVPLDSADVWSERKFFQLDTAGRPTEVAGCPPDGFTADGQLWGNALYDWKRMRRDGFGWWIRRLRAAARLYDVIRIDHFRGLESYWAVPAGDKTARNGRWRPGPGKKFVNALRRNLPETSIIAEDLGFLTEAVEELRAYSGYPGMKILQFAFGSGRENQYLPYRYERNSVCYTGTHDNATLLQWLQEARPEERAFCREYLHLYDGESWCRGILRAGMSSVSDLFVSQLQDWLELGKEARMNVPGILGHGNWTWRLRPGGIPDKLAGEIRRMTALYGR